MTGLKFSADFGPKLQNFLVRLTRSVLFIDLLLGVVTIALFCPVTRHGFLNYDDPMYVTENPYVRAGLTGEGFRWAFQSSYASNWHPLTWLSHMADCSLFYLQPAGHHFTNLLFHVANAVLLFHLLRRMTGARWRCALVAALFAWHPLHVESVAWVSERKDVLSTFFLILSIWAYVHYAKSAQARCYLLALGLFALGLMSKPMVVTLPCLLLLLDYWPLRRVSAAISQDALSPDPSPIGWERGTAGWQRGTAGLGSGPGTSHHPSSTIHYPSSTVPPPALLRRLVLEKAPFFALSFASCIVTVWAQNRTGALQSFEAVPLFVRILNALTSYMGYLWKMVWPINLAVFYPLPTEVSPLLAIGSAAVLSVITLLAWRLRRQYPYLLVGWLWYLGALVPVSGLVQAGEQAMADRYTYVPLIGPFIMIAFRVAEWASRRPYRQCLCVALCAGAIAGCLVETRSYLKDWQSSRTLFEHALRVTKNNYLAHNNLGVILKSEGKLAEAMSHYYESVRINPNYANSQFNLAFNLAEQGQIGPALLHFREVERLKMDDAKKHNTFGEALAKEGRLEEAVQHFSEALRRDPNFPRPHYDLALALSRMGRTAEAIAAYHEALRLRPQWTEVLQSLAWLLATHENQQFRDGPEAVRLAERACQLTGYEQPASLDTLAAAYAEVGRFEEAVATAEKALALARAAWQMDLASRIQAHLQSYQSGKPIRGPG